MNRIWFVAWLLPACGASAAEIPLSLSLSLAKHAPPPSSAKSLNVKQLRALHSDIVKPVEATRLWFKKPLETRLGAELDSDLLVQRVEKTFGEEPEAGAAACRNAAIQQRLYVGAMNNMVALSEGRGQAAAIDLLSAMSAAVAYGQANADCRRYLQSLLPEWQSLDAPAKKQASTLR